MLVIPDWLSLRTINPDDCSLLLDFANEFGIHSFADIDVDMLRTCTLAKTDLPTFFKFVRLLGLYGASFAGSLSRYSRPTTHNPVLIDFPIGDNRLLHESSLDRNAVIFLNTLTLKRMDSLRGIGLDILAEVIQADISGLIPAINYEGGRIIDDSSMLQYFYAQPCTSPMEPQSDEPRECFHVLQRNNKNPDGTSQVVCSDCGHVISDSGPVVKESIQAYPQQSEPLLVIPYQLTVLAEKSIQHLDLNVRAFNILTRNRIATVGQLAKLTAEQIRSYKNCGLDTLKHINERLESFLTSEQLLSLRFGTVPTHDGDQTPHRVIEEPEVDLPKVDLKELLGDELAANLDDCALDDITKLRALPAASFILLLGKDTGLKAWSLVNNTQPSLDEPMLGLEAPESDPADPSSCSQAENPLFQQIKSAPFSNDTKSALERNGYTYLWQIYAPQVRQVVIDLGHRAWAETSSYAFRIGLRTLPLKLSSTECLLHQLMHICLQVEAKLPQILDHRNLQIFRERRLSSTGKPTLDELGRKYNVTRERIRQIEARSVKTIQRSFSPLLSPIKKPISDLILQHGGVMEWTTCVMHVDHREILNVLMDVLDIEVFFDEQIDLIWHRDLHHAITESGSNIYELIAHRISKNLKTSVDLVSHDQIIESAATTLTEIASQKSRQQISTQVISAIGAAVTKNYFVETQLGSFRKKDVGLFELVTYEFSRQFPTGAFIYKSGEQIWQTLCAVIPGLEKRGGPRYIQQVLTRDHDILLWDTGFYIHKQNINPDMQLVHELISDCINEFDKVIPDLKVHLLFDRKKARLIKGGIPTSAALYSLMRCIAHDRLILDDYPRIRDASAAVKNLKQTELVEQFVKENSPVSKKQILKYFGERGWRPYETENTLSRCGDIVRIGTNFLHITHIQVSNDALDALILKIEQELEQLAHFNIRHIRAKYPILWNAVCNRNLDPHSMEKLLSNLQHVKFKVTRLQVTLENSIDRALSKEISEWIRAYGNYVSVEQLEKEFCQQRGYKQGSIKMALYWSDLLCCYKNCYVHAETIGCTPETLDLVKQTLLDASDCRAKDRLPHVSFDWFLTNYFSKLPPLNDPFEWNTQLLISIIEQLDIAYVFHEAFVLKDNDFDVDDFDDLIGYLIGMVFDNYRIDLKKIENYTKAQGLLDLGAGLRREDVFFDGSSVELIDEGQSVMLSSIGRQRYTKV
ncbi:MAG: hypothetical protein K2W82_09445 [Candidatus Obscuribacterales bacterium]|nr:hypothetical protein [Candidatus Obscuribacterales bacterium]